MAIGVLLSSRPPRGRQAGMSAPDGKTSREERLADKLRENLRRRKEQARAHRLSDDGLSKKPEDG